MYNSFFINTCYNYYITL